jgi:hypothetical protein
MLSQGTVGPDLLSDGVTAPGGFRQGKLGDVIMSELHGRFYEQNYRGNLYSIGCSVTALSANTITLTATSTPILGVWNPAASPVNVVVMQCALQSYPNTLTSPASPGAFVWASSTGNGAISTGSAPFNRKTMLSAGSQAKGFPGGVALTGLTNNLVIFDGADFGAQGPLAYGTITAPTASGNSLAGIAGVQNFDGGLIVPPGGVLALYNTTSTTTFSVAGRLMWEEVPI